jgi:hypothetical protein
LEKNSMRRLGSGGDRRQGDPRGEDADAPGLAAKLSETDTPAFAMCNRIRLSARILSQISAWTVAVHRELARW